MILKNTKLLLPLSLIIAIANWGCNKKNETFEWNFVNHKKLVYSYSQDVDKREDIAGDTIITQVHGDAEIHVEVKNDSMSDLRLAGLIIRAIMRTPDGSMSDSLENRVPDLVIPDMKKDGSFEDVNTHVMYRVLFPLPKGELKEGETQKQDLRIPVRVNKSPLFCKGFLKVTNKGAAEFEGKQCNQFYVEFKVDDLELPSGTVDQYSYDNYGSGTYYFDQSNGLYLGADIVSFSYIGYETDLESPNYTYNVEESESSYQFRLKETNLQ